MSRYVLALDQGTTSSRAIVFSKRGEVIASAQQEFPQILPHPGEVEHNAEDIWQSQLETGKAALKKANLSASDIVAIGVANQRETVVLWEKATGKPVANAIVWQSRVSAPICDQLKSDGHEGVIRSKTGLVVDAYFSGTKIRHLLNVTSGLQERAERGEILAGTIDSFLIWRLTGGKQHVTDVSNASRTMLFNIHTMQWDDQLLKLLDIPAAMLPAVKPSSHVYGETEPQHFGAAIPLAGMAGDQQAATFGQACFETGSAKSTYGTGSFLLMNTGAEAVTSNNNLLTTVGWSIGGETTYCLEGSVFIAGAAVQWLRDGLGIIEKSTDVEALAATVEDSDGVILVPAFTGLGAPHWDPYARGAMFGLTRGTTAAHVARATVESMAWQTRDLIDAMRADSGVELKQLKVDGGAAANNSLMQFQADVLGVEVVRPTVNETTALGAAYLAGLATGFWESLQDIRDNWALDTSFQPAMEDKHRKALHDRWSDAVQRTLGWRKPE